MLICPARSPFRVSSRLPGGLRRSSRGRGIQLTEFAQGPILNVAGKLRLDCPCQIRSVSLHLNDRIIDHPNSVIRDTYQVFHSFIMHLMPVLNGNLPADLFFGGVKGFHTQQLETAKGLIDLFQHAAGAGFVYRQPSQYLIPLPGARAAMAT